MTVNLSPELEQQIRKRAAANGVDCASFVEAMLREGLSAGRTPRKDSRAPISERQAATARIRERRRGTNLGPDLTIRQLIEEGRRY